MALEDCDLLQGRQIDCRDGNGGAETVYITELENELSKTTASGIVTAFTLNTGKKFWTYDLEKEIGELTETEQVSVENGSTFYEQVVTFSIMKLTASSRNELRLLAQNRLHIIVKDNNGTFWLLGEERGMDKVGTNESKTGKAIGDLNGYNLAFLGKEQAPMVEVTASLLDTLTVAAP